MERAGFQIENELHGLFITDELRPIIKSKRDIIYSFVEIIKTLSLPSRSIKDALKSLFRNHTLPSESEFVDRARLCPAPVLARGEGWEGRDR